MIHGIGSDIINIKRIESAYKKYGTRFLNRIYSSNELEYYKKILNPHKAINFLAKRFAAKEAFSKAFGTGIRGGISFKEIEVNNDALGKPLICLYGKTKQIVDGYFENKSYTIFVTLKDEDHYALAFVVIEYTR